MATDSEDAAAIVRPRDLRPRDLEEAIATLFQAFNERDIEGALALVHPDVVFSPVSAAVMREGEPYCGHDGIRSYLADVETHWDELAVRPVQIRAAGRAVVALGQVSGRARMGSFEDLPTKWVFKFEDGLVISGQVFADEDGAIKALGPLTR